MNHIFIEICNGGKTLAKTFLSCFVFVLCFTISSSLDVNASSEPVMKVKLRNYLGNQTQIMLEPKGNFTSSDHKIMLKDGQEYKLQLENKKLVLYQGTSKIGYFDSLTVYHPSESGILYINHRPYSGSFQFILESINSKDYIRPINHIKMEDYLKGVVPFEMPALWAQEALKAQTIAARTYAFSHAKNIIDDTIHYQVYGGFQGHPNSDMAVKETSGQVLKYKGQLISAVFSASNGGKTESNHNVWGSTPVSYFTVRNDDYDPKTIWTVQINKKQIDTTGKSLSNYDQWWDQVQEKDRHIIANMKGWLSSNGYQGKELKIISIPSLTFSSPASGGRMTKGSITVEFLVEDKGKVIPQNLDLKDVPASKIRAILGIRNVRSYLVDKIENTNTTIKILGRGDGHGVGLSQWGAKNRADAGQTVNQILAFYYPGTTLIQEYSGIQMSNVSGLLNVAVNHPFYKEMTYLLNEKIIKGYPDGTFRPSSFVTRGQAATMIGRALGLNGKARKTIFKDVDSSSDSSGYIASAVDKGIITGFPDKTYRPNVPVTRGQMANLISRAFELKTEVPMKFSDVQKQSSSYVHISRILAEGITQGYPDGTFKPNQSITRAQFSAFLARALDEKFKVEKE